MSADAAFVGRRFFEELLGRANWAAAPEILAPDVVMHHPTSPEPVQGHCQSSGLSRRVPSRFS